MDYNDTGKVSFDHIYDHPDPRAYFGTLGRLDYCIPQQATGYFRRLLARRAARYQRPSTVLDIGCSYGINAALLRCGLTMGDLYRRYCDGDAPTVATPVLLARDQETVRSRDHLPGTRFIGLDASLPALSYATQAGFLDDAVHGDLEAGDPTARQRQQLAATDLIISTGCIGYVTGQTLSRVLDANDGRRPWLAHFVLRMFPFDPVADCLAGFGYETVGYGRLFKQRRFASAQEQALVLDTLAEVGVDSHGLEADGWFYARLFVSCLRGESDDVGREFDPGLSDG
ncbi:MAG TPA: class I SAM-dependent methyltransferase [Streptosporangiaceae bacterium]|jgi:carnitine O-acetyltransferase|nr:class I SAM-dependent methyltransferase [Streptosporangiaceae bacterium]